MKKISIYLLVLILAGAPFLVPAQTGFQTTYGTTFHDYGNKIIFTNDSCFVFLGNFNFDAYMVKTDTAGNTLWQKSYKRTPPSGFQGLSLRQTPDNGFIMVGCGSSQFSSNSDMLLVKTNVTGDTLWSRAYRGPSPGSNRTFGYDIVVTPDNGYAVIGKEDGQDENIFMIRTDSIGNVLWSKKFSGLFDEVGFAIKQTADEGFIIAGYSYMANTFRDVFLLRLTATGDIAWSKTYGSTRYDYARDVELTNDGGFIVTGLTSGTGTGTIYDDDLFLLKVDSSGNDMWSFTYGGDANEMGTSVKQTADGGFIATGYTASSGSGMDDAYLLKTDSGGDVEWSQAFGGAADDIANDVIEFTGGLAVIGTTRNFSKGLTDIYLIKTDSYGNGTCKQDTALTYKTIQPWIVDTGITATNGYLSFASSIIYGSVDSLPADPCICQPPVAFFSVGLTDICASFYDYSTWADTWFWDFGNGDTSILEEPSYCWAANGTYTICLTVTNACGTSTYCDSMFVSMGLYETNNQKTSIHITPNPSSGNTLLRFNNDLKENLTLLFLNPAGQLLKQEELNENTFLFSVNEFDAGVYFILLKNNEQVIGTEKLVVIK